MAYRVFVSQAHIISRLLSRRYLRQIRFAHRWNNVEGVALRISLCGIVVEAHGELTILAKRHFAKAILAVL